jgi:Cd2+/Zn2+-exporting ATPase
MAHKTLSLSVLVEQGDCRQCLNRLEDSLSQVEGVVSAQLEGDGEHLTVVYDPALISIEEIKTLAHESGVALMRRYGHVTLDLTGLDCPDCSKTLEKALSRLPGVVDVSVNFAASRLKAEYELERVAPKDIVSQIEGMGYGALEAGRRQQEQGEAWWRRDRRLVLTAASGFLLILGFASGFFLESSSPVRIALFSLALLLGGYPSFRAAFYSLRRALTFDMNVLVSVAIVGAVAIRAWEEAAVVAFLFSLGNTLESFTLERTRGAIKALMGLSPKVATVRRNGASFPLPVKEVRMGDVILVKPGERIPLDGLVVEGASTVNQAPITGESLPVEKGAGDKVFAGSINEKGSLMVQVTHTYQDTTLAKITNLVEEAQTQRAPSQRLVDRFARYYTPAVIAGSALVATVPPWLLGEPFGPWLYRALALLLTACPCALVISTPVSIVSAIGNAARRGILIKGGTYLEEVGTLRAFAFDKTGTLTQGRLEVTDILPLNGQSPEEVLALAAGVESYSEHPLAQAILREARHKGIVPTAAQDFRSLTGLGAQARVDGQIIYLGNLRLFQEKGLPAAAQAQGSLESLHREGKIAILLGNERQALGVIALSDRVRDSAREAVAGLRQQGVSSLVMLSGDNEGTARAIAQDLGMEYRAELLPQEKVEAVQELRARHGKVAMVGDGVNDAPAMAVSSVGVAMGAAGVDVALETADIALMTDDLRQLPYLVGLSRHTKAVILQNALLSLLVKAAVLSLVFPGLLTLWLAVAADMGSTLLVTLNGMRLLGRGKV